MKLIFNSIIPKIFGVGGITLYPFVCMAAPIEKCSLILINHEMIHVKQIKEIGFFHFYASYVWQYLRGRYRGLSHNAAYRAISFEIEAYAKQGETE